MVENEVEFVVTAVEIQVPLTEKQPVRRLIPFENVDDAVNDVALNMEA